MLGSLFSLRRCSVQALLAELCPQFQDTVMYSRNSYKQINISCVDSPTFCYYFTQHFIKKKSLSL